MLTKSIHNLLDSLLLFFFSLLFSNQRDGGYDALVPAIKAMRFYFLTLRTTHYNK